MTSRRGERDVRKEEQTGEWEGRMFMYFNGCKVYKAGVDAVAGGVEDVA